MGSSAQPASGFLTGATTHSPDVAWYMNGQVLYTRAIRSWNLNHRYFSHNRGICGAISDTQPYERLSTPFSPEFVPPNEYSPAKRHRRGIMRGQNVWTYRDEDIAKASGLEPKLTAEMAMFESKIGGLENVMFLERLVVSHKNMILQCQRLNDPHRSNRWLWAIKHRGAGSLVRKLRWTFLPLTIESNERKHLAFVRSWRTVSSEWTWHLSNIRIAQVVPTKFE